MKRAIATLLIAIAGAATSFAQDGTEIVNLNNYTDSVSYLMGVEIAHNLQNEGVRLNVAILSAGVEDVINRVEARLTPTQRMNVLMGLQERAQELEAKGEGEAASEKNAEKLYGKVSSNPPTKIKTVNDSVSYCVGFNIGDEIRQQHLGLNTYVLIHALKATAMNKPSQLTENDILLLRMRLQGDAMAEQTQMNESKQEGEKFLAENAARPGVVTLPSGLQYEVLQEGNGEKPTVDDEVTVHYRGTLVNGTEFDSSIERGEPATFPLNKVIKGWIEGLQLMSVGSKWKLYIPSALAYGTRGAGSRIPPNSALIFEVELLSITR